VTGSEDKECREGYRDRIAYRCDRRHGGTGDRVQEQKRPQLEEGVQAGG
jgi:hypothetical protein